MTLYIDNNKKIQIICGRNVKKIAFPFTWRSSQRLHTKRKTVYQKALSAAGTSHKLHSGVSDDRDPSAY